jgi:F-type H+-transporting ATPase subunit b
MNINATLLGQMITFAIFVTFTLYFIWPLMNESLEKRRIAISEGLAAAERGRKLLKDTEEECAVKIEGVKVRCEDIIKQAKEDATLITTVACATAAKEREAILQQGRNKLEKDVAYAKLLLQKQVGELVILGTEKLLSRRIVDRDQFCLLGDVDDDIGKIITGTLV